MEADTLQTMNYQTVLMLIQTLIGLGAVYLAIKEINKWRKEEIGKRKIEIARELGNSLKPINTAFKLARHPLGWGAPKYEPDSTDEDKRKQDREYDYRWRVTLIEDSLKPLDKFSWEISKLFKTDGAAELINQLDVKRDEFMDSYKAYHGLSRARLPKDIDIVYGGTSDTEFSREIGDILGKLERIADKHYRE